MNQMAEKYPLQWPAGWKRARSRLSSKFKAAEQFGKVRDGLLHEISLMGGTQVVLSTNIPLTKDGLPYAKHAQPADPGVAVYFKWNGKPMSLACDKWRTVIENIRALQLTVEAMRGIDRWGSSELMERSFTGFTALPAPDQQSNVRTWKAVLGFHELTTPTLTMVKEKRNELVRKYHPDFGSDRSQSAMAAVNEAFAQAERELS